MHCMVHQLILIENIYKKCSLYLEKLGFEMLDCVELMFIKLFRLNDKLYRIVVVLRNARLKISKCLDELIFI